MRRDPSELQPGQLVDRYQLLLPVATGGTSQIWAARRCGTRGFEKLVALKTLAVPDSESRELERLLWREGRLASRIQHANVVQYFDLIEQDGVLCLVMEWIDGESLSSLLRKVSRAGGLPLGIAVQILVQACRGLQAAHELRGADGQPLGLAHCDVSPQNLMIDGSGVVKLIDFGIAKVRRFDGGGDDRVRGKPSFMAPEQAMRQHVDLRADIFSLGIMGYLLTTGHHPFGARNATDTLLAICSDVPVATPCSVVESYPRALQRVVLRALARQPALRYQSAAEMLEDLVAAFPGYASESELAGLLHSACGSALDSRRALVNEALGRYSTPTLADSPVAPALLAEPTSDTLSPAQLAAQPAFAAARTTRWRPTHVAVAAGVVAFTAAFSWTVTQTAARFGVPSERAAPVVHAARASESPTQVAALPSAGAQAAPQSSPAPGGADLNHPPAPTEPAPESVAPAASNGRSASQRPPAKKRKVIAVGQRYGI